MSVKIRLRRMGNKNRPFYRLVVSDSRNRRDGRFLETLGYYDPTEEPAKVNIKEDLVAKWMNQGAQVSDTVRSLLKQQGMYARIKGLAVQQPATPSEETKAPAEPKAEESESAPTTTPESSLENAEAVPPTTEETAEQAEEQSTPESAPETEEKKEE